MPFLVNISRAMVDWLIPQSCLLCGASADQPMCQPCRRDLPWLRAACDCCALPLASAGTCPECLRKPPSFEACVSPLQFTNPVGPRINQFKRRRLYRNGKELSALLVESLRGQKNLPNCIVPVPLHWRRLLWRGFNQAVFIAQEVGAALDIPVESLLKRRIASAKQQGLSRKQRLQNLQGVFVVNNRHNLPHHVALVDDVMTTGATAEACAAVLKQRGVERVDIWVLARTPAPRSKL